MRPRCAGFTLIELILVIVVVAVAAVSIGSAFSYIARAQGRGTDLLGATQVAQECAEHILGRGRKPNTYAGVPAGATACNAIVVPTGYARTVLVTAVAGGGVGDTICTGAGWACNSVAVTATRGVATVTVNFMLINY